MMQLTIQQAFDLALQHHKRGSLKEAEQLYRRILAQQPEHSDAMHNLGVLAHQTGRNVEAIEHLSRAIGRRPGDAQAFNNLGNAFKGVGRFDEAIAAYHKAISMRPAYAEAHYNLAGLLSQRGELGAAIAAYEQAISLRPDFVEAYSNLGSVLCGEGRTDEAIAAFNRAIEIKATPAAYHNLGNAFSRAGQIDRAIACYRRAIGMKPDDASIDASLMYALPYDPAQDRQSIAYELRRWDRQHAQPLRKFILPPSVDHDLNRRIRIGYVSPDFRDHVVAHNLLPLFRQHDRQQFEITCYAQLGGHDEMTDEFVKLADRWRETAGRTDQQVAEQIREDRIDILVDLAMHTAQSRLLVFARKPAPVQVTFAGYPGSTGLTTMDYRLSDPYLDPLGMDESVYSERTIRLPDSFWCYEPVDARDIEVNPLPAMQANAVTFGCLNKFCKVNDGVLRLWARVLREIDHSRLLLLTDEGSHRHRTLEHLAGEGIAGERIDFVPRQSRREYLRLYHRIDIGLDTFPYNGHTTSLDSFWMGVPVVTLMGQTPVSRAGWCQLSNLHLEELAAQTPEQFVGIAAALARDLPRLQALRVGLRSRMEESPLMDGRRFASNIEAAYRQMWRACCESPRLNPR
jgi:predicted O-linked N-acetylglucosamine transferase (SPINDLY family)